MTVLQETSHKQQLVTQEKEGEKQEGVVVMINTFGIDTNRFYQIWCLQRRREQSEGSSLTCQHFKDIRTRQQQQKNTIPAVCEES